MKLLVFLTFLIFFRISSACVPEGETTIDRIKRHEGLSLCVYEDFYGNPTIGYGHLLTKPVAHEMCWNDAYANVVLERDVAYSAISAAHDFGNAYPLLPSLQASVLTELAFWIGGAGLSKFTDFLALMRQGDYAAAADDLDGTLLAKQVPGRAKELSCLLRSYNG